MIIKDIQKRFEQAVRLAAAGADEVPDGLSFGPPVQIWKKYDDTHVSWETLPEWLAKQVLATFADEDNPEHRKHGGIKRAMIVRRRTELDYFLLSDLAHLMAKTMPLEAA